MIHLVISHEADDDLRAIWKYIGVENGNVEAANRIVEAIRDVLLLLPRFPQLGKHCPEFEEYVGNLQSFSVEGYIIYYRMTDDRIDVGRIVNTRQDRERIVLQWSTKSDKGEAREKGTHPS